jgi:hypothetical protein
MNYKDMLLKESSRWGMPPEDLEAIMNRIASHESAGTMDASIHQTSGGPGRGLFQFEVGKEQGGATAGNRLLNYYSDIAQAEAPDWLTALVGSTGKIEDLDASKLSPEQQKMLFIGNYRMHPDASLKGVNEGNLGKFWADYHWAGEKEGSDLYKKKLQSFLNSQVAYDVTNTKTPEEAAFASPEKKTPGFTF